MPKLVSRPTLAVLGIALLISRYMFRSPPPPKWHQGANWERLFVIYDKIAAHQFNDCESRLIESRFGHTMVHACGSIDTPPVFLFHGLGINSLIWGDWLVPTLQEKYYAVSVDFLCDVTRSLPKDGDVKNCPQSSAELYEWMMDIKEQLGIAATVPASVIGYSYGAFVATQIAIEDMKQAAFVRNDESTIRLTKQIDKVIMIAPASIVAPISKEWLVRIIAYSVGVNLLGSIELTRNWLRSWFFGYMMHEFEASYSTWSSDQIELRAALDGAEFPQIAVPPVEIDFDVLKDLTRQHEVLLVIGDKETVIDSSVALHRAKKARIHVQMYQGAGHMLLIEHPRDLVKVDVRQFLDEADRDKEFR